MKDNTIADINDAHKVLAEKDLVLYIKYGTLWYEILREIGATISQLVVDDINIELPYNLGHFTMTTKEQDTSDISKFKTDIIATKLLWKERPELKGVKFIKYMSDDLTYNSFRWIRNKGSQNVRYIRYYKISIVRTTKQLIAKAAIAGRRYDINKVKIIE